MMTSANTPYLLTIINKLESVESRLTGVESRLTGVESRLTGVEFRLSNLETAVINHGKRIENLENAMHNVQRFIKRESNIQEVGCTQFIKHHIESNRIFARVTSIRFGKFYTPYSNQEVTDIDGCLLVETVPIMVKNDTGRNHNLTYSATYFIETKHGLTMALVNKKLKQFVTILNTVHQIKHDNVQSLYANYNTMVTMNSMRLFPTPTYFIFGSDDIQENLQNYIKCVNSACDKNTYYESVFKNVKTHEIVHEIIHNSNLHKTLRTILNTSSNMTGLLSVFDKSVVLSKYKSTPKLLSGLDEMLNYKQSIMNLFEPYESIVTTMNMLKGLLGFRGYDDETIVIPAPDQA